MPIPEAQLETWSHQGSVTQSSSTYQAIKNVLEATGTPYAAREYKVFLQGSYGNDTNIYAESDVDVVIRLDDIYYSDISDLSPPEKAAYDASFVAASYAHSDFKRDVTQVLTAAYGSDVTSGDKAIAIAARGSRRKVDVIAAAQFRRYYKFNDVYDHAYAEGICFWNAAGDRIANYPNQHSANVTKKHQGANGWFKPMVRVLKNLRGHCVSKGYLASGVAPSYYLEGLLYNVPLSKFGSSCGDCFVDGFNWIRQEADRSQFVCANEQYYLLRDDSHVCWPPANGEAFIDAAVRAWNSW
jgi:hypothetical protein